MNGLGQTLFQFSREQRRILPEAADETALKIALPVEAKKEKAGCLGGLEATY